MTNLDIVFGVLLLFFLIWGMLKGLLWTLVRFASFAGVILVISAFGENFRYELGDRLGVSPAIATLITYVLIFILMMILGKLVYLILRKLIKSLDLGCLNRMAGGLFAGLAYFLILAMLVILIDLSPISLNGRGVRPRNHRQNFKKLSEKLQDEMMQRRSEVSDMDMDRVWEALDEANQRFEKSHSEEERDMAMTDLYQTVKSALGEIEFGKLHEKLQVHKRQIMRFEGKELTIGSFILEEMAEPLADFIEIKFMGFDV